MIIDSTVQHVAQAVCDRVATGGIPSGEPIEPKSFHEWCIGEFRCTAQAALLSVDHGEDAVCKGSQALLLDLGGSMCG